METWKIIVFVVILVLLMLGAWYAIKLQWKELEKRTYVYPKTGHKYMPLYRCRMENGELYVREYKDFFDKFVKLLDWENGTKESGQY